MLSVELALQLRAAGLPWQPTEGDVFVVPGTELADQIFVLSSSPVIVQQINGVPAVLFHGSAEWALDYVSLSDVVWLPSETRLREVLAEHLTADAGLALLRSGTSYRCAIEIAGMPQVFEAASGEDAYALALLAVLASAN